MSPLCSHLATVVTCLLAQPEPGVQTYTARDTLRIARDAQADAQACLDGLAWTPGEFPVTWTGTRHALTARLVHFPSPRPTGDACNDQVALEWYAACNDEGQVIRAPAIVVVHESGSQMPVGRLFARSLRAYGVHAFLIHLPHYGQRRTAGHDWDRADFLPTMRQAVADVRRARDAVAGLPDVDASRIGLQGTSLGGFVAALAGSLDGRFSAVFIMLAGGHLDDIVAKGVQDTAELRERLAAAGFTGEKRKQLLWELEPTRVAHRLHPNRTWLYTAIQDPVVPLANSVALARAARLDDSHHIQLPGDHYSAIIHFPTILEKMVSQFRAAGDTPRP